MLRPVYIYSAYSTRITGRPRAGYFDLCLEAVRGALEGISPLKIDSFYLASMDPAVAGVTGEVSAALSADLHLLPKETLAVRGTSSAGGVAGLPAYKDIALGMYDYSLLVSCEQMNRVLPDGAPYPEELRAQDRAATAQMLGSVIDPAERRYGLTMVLIGDLYERALLRYLGLSKAAFRELASALTLAMQARAARYPLAHFFGQPPDPASYERSPWVSPHYRRDDVVPVSTAASALVLSSHPPPDGRAVRIVGVGQGIQHPALSRRFGPVTCSPSVRRALCGMARGWGVSPAALREVDLAFPHDAFPSISRMILKEAGFSHEESVEGLLAGRFNPLGGLLKCGHPVGCSGELQLVRAFQMMTQDRSVVPEELLRQPAQKAFTVTVGSALTNIVAFALEAGMNHAPTGTGAVTDSAAREAEYAAYLSVDGAYDRFEAAMQTLAEGCGVVLAGTRSALGWVSLLQLRDQKAMALAAADLEPGTLVRVRTNDRGGADGFNEVGETVEEQVSREQLVAFGVEPG
ncbi:MAG: hypothetical protein IT371_04630 [Deltaproteobacteria bacterium]|nr:hypothetical protein [Deltaproteobacteria bacterium]